MIWFMVMYSLTTVKLMIKYVYLVYIVEILLIDH